ncbi:MAG: MBL fold metallo-hydrolase [Bacteroidia bacterium]|nr:MBL fold metallo-hydrolase [Bacteroidia bacterium]
MLKIHFLNVGKGNCTIIDFPSGHLTVVDTDNSRFTDENYLIDPVDFIKENYKGKSIFRLIITHPDMDHLSGMDEIEANFTVLNFWDTEHNKVLSKADLDKAPFYERGDWETYQKFRKSTESPKCLFLYRNSSADFWNTDNIQILSPSKSLVKLANEKGEYNHLSYVLMIEYKGVKILLGGDATIEAWNEIYEECGKSALKADIFLAPHHGSKHNVNDDVFQHIKPDWVIASVLKGVDYDYQYYNKLAKNKALSTKHYGNISIEIKDDGNYQVYVAKNADK